MALRFALNRMAAPHIPFGAFCAMAQRLGASAIEIRNGLVHVSGVDVTQLRDGHRALVGTSDRLGNVRQLHRLLTDGYAGYVSFEPFADAIARADDIEESLADSMQYLRQAFNASDIVH